MMMQYLRYYKFLIICFVFPKDALKDLIRFLRKDDNTFAIRRELGQMKVVTLHLLPIVCEYHSDDHLFDVALRLMLNLTNPTLLLYNEELPNEKVQRNQYLQIVSHLQSYKPTLASSKLWSVFTDKLKILLVKVIILFSQIYFNLRTTLFLGA